MKQNKLRGSFIRTLIAVIIALIAISTATFAWYSFNSGANSTEVHMAAGSTFSLSISNEYDGVYGLSTSLKNFNSSLRPVSTNSVLGGFQKVYGWSEGTDVKTKLAKLFQPADFNDFCKTTLFIKSNQPNTKLYIQDIGFEDSNLDVPISSALRVGFVVHKPGKDQPVDAEYIFEINENTFAEEYKDEAYYNTEKGSAGDVLDCTKTDGSVVHFDPYGPKNFCGEFVSSTASLSLNPETISLGTLVNADEPMQIDVYIWLEGCDPECTEAVSNSVLGHNSYLESISFAFAGSDK